MKKLLALLLSALMVVTAFAGFATVSAATGDPVLLIDGDALTATGRAYCVGGTYSYRSGLVRYNWFTQGGPVDPQFNLINSTTTVAPYMVIKYKTTTAGLTGLAFIGNTKLGDSSAAFNYSDASGEWAQVVLYLPDMIDGYYDMTNNQITHFRWDVVENAQDYPDGTLDVEYIAFFNDYADIAAFQHTMPADPDTAVGGSYRTYDFSTVTDLSAVMGSYYDMSAALVDGALRITANGSDPYAKLLNNGSDELGISGIQARYILVKYKTSTTVANPQIKFFSNVPGVASWGGPGSYTNGDALTADGAWHYVMVDASNAWGTHNVGLNAFRIDALDNANAGDTIDIASIKFFTTSDWISEYIADLAATDAAAAEMAKFYGWEVETETEPPVVEPDYVLGDTTGDGIVNNKDMTRLKKFLAGTAEVDSEAAADVTADGTVNNKDMTRLKKFLAGTAELG
jgi:hypothetical protein